MKNIKKLLSQQRNEILPGNAMKDIIKQKIRLEQKQTSLVYAHNGQQKVNNVFKTKLFACSMAIILLLIVGIFIPILLNKLMYIMPDEVQITSIQNTTDTHIEIQAQSKSYSQLGYLTTNLKVSGALNNVISTAGQQQNNIITIKIEGDLP